MNEEKRKTFKISFKDQRRIINKEITLLDLVVEKQEKIERLNNIINELEKYLFTQLQLYGGGGTAQEYYDKLQELKGSDKE